MHSWQPFCTQGQTYVHSRLCMQAAPRITTVTLAIKTPELLRLVGAPVQRVALVSGDPDEVRFELEALAEGEATAVLSARDEAGNASSTTLTIPINAQQAGVFLVTVGSIDSTAEGAVADEVRSHSGHPFPVLCCARVFVCGAPSICR